MYNIKRLTRIIDTLDDDGKVTITRKDFDAIYNKAITDMRMHLMAIRVGLYDDGQEDPVRAIYWEDVEEVARELQDEIKE